MENTADSPGKKLLDAAGLAAEAKGIAKEDVLKAVEEALKKAARTRYGSEKDIRATIDEKSGDIALARYREVVPDDAELINEETQLSETQAHKLDKSLKIGDFFIEPLPPVDFGRIAAQTAKQVIVQKVREAERARQYEEYKGKIGEIVNGVVKHVENKGITVDLGRAEAVLRRNEMIPHDQFRNGDRIRAYLMNVQQETKGPQLFLSRTHPQFLAKLFMQEVPEIYDGTIEIKAVARDPGSRAKMAVVSSDSSIDPVKACVGYGGEHVKAVVTELQGEKVDIIHWSPVPSTLIVDALASVEVINVVLDEEAHKMEVVVPDDQQKIAIGRNGQNVRLAVDLTGWRIDILGETVRQNEIKIRTQRFMDALDVDDMIARLLTDAGFTSVDEIAFVPLNEICAIEAFDEDLATELQNRAKAFVEKQNAEFNARKKELGIDPQLIEFGLDRDVVIKVAEKGVKTLDDFADLASYELLEILGENTMTEREADALILEARKKLGWIADDGEEA